HRRTTPGSSGRACLPQCWRDDEPTDFRRHCVDRLLAESLLSHSYRYSRRRAHRDGAFPVAVDSRPRYHGLFRRYAAEYHHLAHPRDVDTTDHRTLPEEDGGRATIL